MSLFIEKCEVAVTSGPEARQVSSNASPTQIRNLAICASLEEVSNALIRCCASEGSVSDKAHSFLMSATESAEALASEVMEPLFKSIADKAESIMLTVHEDTLWGSDLPSDTAAGAAGCSPSMEELLR